MNAESRKPITAETLATFHRNAPSALARRAPGAMMEEILGGVQTMFFGALPIVGLFYWGWSALEMFLFLLVSLWVGIFCDLAKLIWLANRAQVFVGARMRDFQVWLVVDALRAAEKERATFAATAATAAKEEPPNDTQASPPATEMTAARAEEGKQRKKKAGGVWQGSQGMCIDFLFGGISTAIIMVMLVFEIRVDLSAVISRRLLLALAALFISRVLSTWWEIAHHLQRSPRPTANPKADRPVKVLTALRGVALFLLMFLTVFVADKANNDSDTIWFVAMTILNSLIILFGLLNATGWVALGPETRWLRRYLKQQEITENVS